MKLSIPQKIIIGILVLLIISAVKNMVNIFKPKRTIIEQAAYNYQKNSKIAEEKTFPEGITLVTNDYKYFKDIFASKENVLIYGYTYGAFEDSQSESFHKKLNELIEQEKISIKVVPIKNWRKIYTTKLSTKKNFEISSCSLDDTAEKDYMDNFENLAYTCLKQACIIDNNKKTYTTISRDLEFIVKTLKGEVQIIKNDD